MIIVCSVMSITLEPTGSDTDFGDLQEEEAREAFELESSGRTTG